MQTQNLIIDLCLISTTGVVLSVAARALRLPTIVGYIVAGYLIGPNSPFNFQLISDRARMEGFAELGMILLIFTVGLEMGFRKLRNLGAAPFAIGFAESLGVWALGTLVALALGFSSTVAQFIGATLAISSTTVVLTVLKAKGLSSAKFAEKLVGLLLVEDLVAVLMLVYLPSLANGNHSSDLGRVIAQLVGSLALWWFAGTILSPRIINAAERFGGDELLLLTSLGLCLGLAVLALSLNLSTALGAFMMGAILADCRQNRRIEALMTPLRQIFGVLFFVSFGMFFNPAKIPGNWPLFITILGTLVVGKFVLTSLTALIAGEDVRDALRMGGTIPQIGEFAFVIGGMGLTTGVLSDQIFSVICAVAVISIILTPWQVELTNRYTERVVAHIPAWIINGHRSYVQALQSLLRYRHSIHRNGLIPFAEYLSWFSAKLRQNYRDLTHTTTSSTLDRLAPWDEYLTEIVVAPGSELEGKSLLEINARERFGVTIVAVERTQFTQVSPEPTLRILPGDQLLVYGVEEGIRPFARICATRTQAQTTAARITLQECDLRLFRPTESHPFTGKTLSELGIRESYSCTILAIVRAGERIKNPRSDFRIEAGDELFVVGPRLSLQKI